MQLIIYYSDVRRQKKPRICSIFLTTGFLLKNPCKRTIIWFYIFNIILMTLVVLSHYAIFGKKFICNKRRFFEASKSQRNRCVVITVSVSNNLFIISSFHLFHPDEHTGSKRSVSLSLQNTFLCGDRLY